MEKIDRQRVERVTGIHSSNQAAGAALGIRPSSFARPCRHYGIETPHRRHRRHLSPGPPAAEGHCFQE
jgi:hypothetical protein